MNEFRPEKRAQRLTFWVRRPPGRVGVFHAKGWWPKSSCPPSKVRLPWVLKRASGPQKGPAERGHVKTRQKASKIFSTLFDFRAGQKTTKIVTKCQKHFRQCSRRTSFPAPFWGALREESGMFRVFCRDVPDPWGS